MSSFVALLRGINVGGKNLVRMPDLVACFCDAGYRNVRTYIQSGNVLFTTDRPGGPELEAVLERMLEERFSIPILVVSGRVRSSRPRSPRRPPTMVPRSCVARFSS